MQRRWPPDVVIAVGTSFVADTATRRRGVLFERVFTSSRSHAASVISLLTGQPVPIHGADTLGKPPAVPNIGHYLSPFYETMLALEPGSTLASEPESLEFDSVLVADDRAGVLDAARRFLHQSQNQPKLLVIDGGVAPTEDDVRGKVAGYASRLVQRGPSSRDGLATGSGRFIAEQVARPTIVFTFEPRRDVCEPNGPVAWQGFVSLPETACGIPIDPRGLPAAVSELDLVPTALSALGRDVELFPGYDLRCAPEHRRIHISPNGMPNSGGDIEFPMLVHVDDVETTATDLSGAPAGTEPLEPATFVVAVNDNEQARANLFRSEIHASTDHEWLVVDNAANGRYENITELYADASDAASTDLVFFLHQDVFLPPWWESRMGSSLATLDATDPDWGVVGVAGVTTPRVRPDGRLVRHKSWRGHWCDPKGYRQFGPLPKPVFALDEMLLGFRKSSGLGFDRKLPGFHCYGIDVCLAAADAGRAAYAVDAFTWHKYRGADERLITAAESPKLRRRGDASFRAEFAQSADFIEHKWADRLPFHSTYHRWDTKASA